MKKILLICLFLVISITTFGQGYTLVFSVKADTTPFPRTLPVNSIVFVTDSMNNVYNGRTFFKLNAIAVSGSSLSTVAHAPITQDSISATSLSFINAYGGNIYCDSIWATTHYAVSAFDTIQTVDSLSVTGNTNIRGNLSVNDTLFWNTIYPTPFDSTHCWSKLYTDSLSSCSPLVIYSNDTSYYTALGHKFNTDIYMDGYKVLTTTDTTSTLLTQSKATNTYQLKYWSKTGTAIQPYTTTDTVVAPYIRLNGVRTTGTVLTKVTKTGLLDTIATTPINPIYVKKAGDTMGGSLIMNSGSILFDDYAFASGDKVAIIHESGLLDTATTVTADNAVINTLTISDSIRIGGLWYIGDTAIIADEDSIIIPVNRSMFGQIFVDSVGYMVAYANSFYVDANGTPHIVSNSSRVVATNTDTNVICLYAYAGNLILRNRSGSTLKYKIILNG